MYGHQIRRDARMDRADVWSSARPGSRSGALHRLAAEGLIEPVRTEQSGHLPARTVYAITAEGRRELKTLRAEALSEVGRRPGPGGRLPPPGRAGLAGPDRGRRPGRRAHPAADRGRAGLAPDGPGPCGQADRRQPGPWFVRWPGRWLAR